MTAQDVAGTDRHNALDHRITSHIERRPEALSNSPELDTPGSMRRFSLVSLALVSVSATIAGSIQACSDDEEASPFPTLDAAFDSNSAKDGTTTAEGSTGKDGGGGDVTQPTDGGPDTAPVDAGIDVACTLSDGGGGLTCSASCADIANDPTHCGSCTSACDGGAVCTNGGCVDIVGSLTGLRWELPCGSVLSAQVCTTNASNQNATVQGPDGGVFDVTLRFRGVVEQKTYTGGTTDGGAIPDAGVNPQFFLVGGGDNGDGFNVYKLEISDPAQTFFLNAGASNILNSYLMDYTATVRMAGGATVTLSGDPKDGQEIMNLDVDGGTIVVPGVPPDPQPFNGQFVQMDVVSVTKAP